MNIENNYFHIEITSDISYRDVIGVRGHAALENFEMVDAIW